MNALNISGKTLLLIVAVHVCSATSLFAQTTTYAVRKEDSHKGGDDSFDDRRGERRPPCKFLKDENEPQTVKHAVTFQALFP